MTPMETQSLQEILSWMKRTDLVELAWRAGSDGLELRLEGAGAAPAAAFPANTLAPVSSTGVGLFRWNAPGKPRRAEEGAAVAAGELLGILETGDKPVEIKATAGGRLAKVLIDDGKPVQYGQLLFLIAP